MNSQNTNSKHIEDIYPLSPMQQGLLYHALLDDAEDPSNRTGVYLPQIVLTLTGLSDVAAFKAAWQRTVDRHPALRTAFQWEKRDQPFQVVYRRVELPWQQQDWRCLSATSSEPRSLETFLDQDRQQGFNLKTAPLMRLTLIRTGDSDYVLVWTQHHLILDGWSAGLVLQQVFADYHHQPHNPQSDHQSALRPSRPYRDYIAWLRQQDQASAKRFWQTQLRGFTSPTVLPTQARPSHSPSWSEQSLSLSPTVTATLKTLAQQHHCTLNTLMQAAFGLLLSRYSNETDVVFGSTVAGRPAALAGSESMVGLFINTLPVRLQLPIQEKLLPWLQAVQLQQAEALPYDYTPLLDIQTWSEVPAGTPLFDSLLVFENYPVDPAALQRESGLRLTQVQSVEWTSLPLTLVVSLSEQLTLKLKFDQQQFDSATIDRLLHHLQTLLHSIAANPHQRLLDLPLLTPTEQQQIQNWNQTRADYPPIGIHEWVEAQCHQTPDAMAAVFAAPHASVSHLTYAQLNASANQLAHYLHRLGVPPETPIGIYLERSLDLAIAILAVLKVGAAYVPLDPSYPAERLRFMLRDAQIPIVLSHSRLEFTIHTAFNTDDAVNSDANSSSPWYPKFIPLGVLSSQIAELPTTNLDLPVALDQSAYIIYTSGSTGHPKGVINTHRGLVNRLAWMQQAYHLTAADRVLQKTPFSFDVSVWEFFWPWITGACLVIAPPDIHRDSAALAQLIQSQQITTLHFVPSMLHAFLEEPQAGFTAVQRIFCSGEALPSDLANRCLQTLNASLHNLYGPTEAAIDVSYFSVEQEAAAASVPIGKPISNIQLYILDSHFHLVPIGIPGELYIAGVGLARGYLNQPALTAEKFIPNPFVESSLDLSQTQFSRLYKTGDRACYLADGSIQFLGRTDTQIKLRGYRIELGEIEALLVQHPEIQQAIVTLTSTPHPHLTAYLVPASPSSLPLTPSLSDFLRCHLPDFMIPTTVLWLDRLPLTPNGKLDRRSLPAPDAPVRAEVPPRTPTEAIVAAIWSEVLQLDPISVEDSFFELGGNSLLATRINSRLRQAFQLEIPLRSLLERPTIAALAARIDLLQATLNQPATSTHQPGRKEIEL